MEMRAVLIVLMLMGSLRAWALGESKYVSTTPVSGGFVLEAEGHAAALLVSHQDWPGVVRAAGDLSVDVGRLTGRAAAECTRSNGHRQLELIDGNTFSRANYHEADSVYDEWDRLAVRVDTLATQLPKNQRASYFDLIQYPVDACANLTEMHITAGRNALAARLGNPRANDEVTAVERMFARDAVRSAQYNGLLTAKWNHMMDQTHIGYVSWNDPPVNGMPAVSRVQVSEERSLGVSAQDALLARAGGHFGFSLRTLDSVNQQARTLVDPATVVEKLTVSYGPLRPGDPGPPQSFHAGGLR